MHIKKTQMPTSWPIPRKGKGKRYVAVPSHAAKKGISLLFLLRDVLKLAKTRKEARHMTLNGMVKVNNKIRHDENFPVQVFDVVNLDKAKLNYRLEIINKKFRLEEIPAKDADTKIVKISGKKVLEKNKIQMNLNDGQNIITKEKFSVGDSALLNTKKNTVEKILPLKEGANVEVVVGKHAGEKGKIEGFEELVRGRNYIVKLEDKTVSLPYKTILVIA
jgi:small subunit ribosomal protein S4e